MTKTRNRYGVAFAGVVLHLMIGGVYAWSVFTKPIAQQTGCGKPQSRLRLAWPSFVWACQLPLWVGWSKNLAQPLLVPSPQSFTAPASC